MSNRPLQTSVGQKCTQVWDRTCYGVRGEHSIRLSRIVLLAVQTML